jgi:hypothetical protein
VEIRRDDVRRNVMEDEISYLSDFHRAFIEAWLEEDNRRCEKAGEKLLDDSLAAIEGKTP